MLVKLPEQSGIYIDSLQSTDGCDSIVETTLTISSQIIANVSVSFAMEIVH